MVEILIGCEKLGRRCPLIWLSAFVLFVPPYGTFKGVLEGSRDVEP
jgi:hypothetical protein